jgi:hypothetical protein
MATYSDEGGSGAAIGSPVPGAGANRIPFINGSGNLDDDADLTYNETTNVLTHIQHNGDTNPSTATMETVIRNDTANASWIYFSPDGTNRRVAVGYTRPSGNDSGNVWGGDQGLLLTGNNVERLKWDSNGVHIMGKLARAGGTVFTAQTDVGNVGAGEDDLHSKSIAASTLSVDGEALEATFVFTFAANANSKRVRIYFGATAVYDSTAQVQNGGSLSVRVRIVRTGAATQRGSATAVNDAGTPLFGDVHQYTTPGETLSGAVTFKATGEGVADNDIVNKMTEIKWTAANA